MALLMPEDALKDSFVLKCHVCPIVSLIFLNPAVTSLSYLFFKVSLL